MGLWGLAGAGHMVGFITLFIHCEKLSESDVKFENGQEKQMIVPGEANTATVNTTK